ncbi:TrmH family RNA methyltransferase [Candidatus Saccharibacteria bacterium]|nr:TrmH family RNA methyltransferase [Candidatus Saccharibacteria bacterium]
MASITVIAHNIRSSYNIGSIFRTCEGFGVSKLILSGYTPYPAITHDTRLPHISKKTTDQIHKTALGAESMVDFEYVENIYEWLSTNKLPLVGLEQSIRSVAINSFQPPKEFILLLGEEVRGIDASLLKECNDIVEIPMHGKKESFNVSVACGVALYAFLSAHSEDR